MKRDLIAVRDCQILDRFRSGCSTRQLADDFGLTADGIVLVLQRHEAAREALLRSDSICSRMRALDDPGVPWAIDDLVAALGLRGTIRTAVLRHFDWLGEPSLTLGGLFDWVVSNTPHRRPGYAICPSLDGRCVGTIGFRALVQAITARDLGPRANALWNRKLDILRRSSQIVGERRTWSKPLDFPIPDGHAPT